MGKFSKGGGDARAKGGTQGLGELVEATVDIEGIKMCKSVGWWLLGPWRPEHLYRHLTREEA